VLDVKYSFVADSAIVEISQKQNTDGGLVYRLPLDVDVWVGKKVETHRVELSKPQQRFAIHTPLKPSFVEIDGARIMLAEKRENKSLEQYIFQYQNVPNVVARYEALKNIKDAQKDNIKAREVMLSACMDRFYELRRYAIEQAVISSDSLDTETVKLIAAMAENDSSAQVRQSAIEKLAKLKSKKFMPIFEMRMQDSSYAVIARSLSAITEIDEDKGLELAARYEREKTGELLNAVAGIYSLKGDKAKQSYFEKTLPDVHGYLRYMFLYHYANFLTRMDRPTVELGVESIALASTTTDSKLIINAGKGSLKRVVKAFEEKKKSAEKELKQLEENKSADKNEIVQLRNKLEDIEGVLTKTKEAIDSIIKKSDGS
jgi:aminopeptidase N